MSKSSIKTRVLILTEAKKLIAKKGFQAASFQKIATACKIHQPAIFYYFKNKEQLLDAVIDDIIIHSHQVVETHTSRALDAKQKMEAHFWGTLSWAMEYPDESIILGLLYYYASFQKDFQKKYKTILERARFRIQSILNESMHQKLVHAHIDLKETSSLLHDCLLGGLVNCVATGKEKDQIKLLKKRWVTLLKTIYLA